MHPRTYLLAAVLWLILACPAQASDETRTVYPTATVPEWAVKMSLRIAARHWQTCQTPGAASIDWLYEPDLTGEAASAWTGDCRINVNTASYPMHYPGPFCDTIVHEYGHVSGYQDPLNTADPTHSHQDGHLMSASGFYVQANRVWTGVHWMCRPVERRAERESRKARAARRHHRPAKLEPGMRRGGGTV